MGFLLRRKRDYFVIPNRGEYTSIKTHKPLCGFAFLFLFTNQNKFCLFQKQKTHNFRHGFFLRRKRDYFVIPNRGKYTSIKTHKPLCGFAFLFLFTNQNKFCLFQKQKTHNLRYGFSFAEKEGFEPPEV